MRGLGILGHILGVAAVALAVAGAVLTFDAAARPDRPDPPPGKTDNSGLTQRGFGI